MPYAVSSAATLGAVTAMTRFRDLLSLQKHLGETVEGTDPDICGGSVRDRGSVRR